ncbi:hypothetical protein ZWY2020_059744 [Hordeum vulgare]|nr:hypothetical protein ZWY2020_059744 [Hordeum vulgare]
MPGLAAAEQDTVSLVRRVARAINRWISDLVALLFFHKKYRLTVAPPQRPGKRKIGQMQAAPDLLEKVGRWDGEAAMVGGRGRWMWRGGPLVVDPAGDRR